MFVYTICKLFNSVSGYIDTASENEETLALKKEWKDFFLDGCAASIASLFFRISSTYGIMFFDVKIPADPPLPRTPRFVLGQ